MQKKILRRCARAALEDRGYDLEVFTGPGIVQGARLVGTVEAREVTISIRTSFTRELSLLRNRDGSWRISSTVDEVVLAVPSLDDPASVEVFCFLRETLVEVFSAALAGQKRASGTRSWTAPVFVALDENQVQAKRRGHSANVTLAERAVWRDLVPRLAARRFESDEQDKLKELLDRVRQEVAIRNGVDLKDVAIKISIASRTRN
jgi:hypothetical protein